LLVDDIKDLQKEKDLLVKEAKESDEAIKKA